jgi:hypothetical protein
MVIIDFNKFFIFASKILNYLFIKPKTPTTMTDQRQTMNAYNDAIELQPTLDNAVLTAQANLKPYQDALDAAIKAQTDNVTLSEGLKAQIISALVPAIPTVVSDQDIQSV